jgi:hypothetical protein
MNAETIIKDEAANFSRLIENFEREHNGAQEFKSELTTALYDYYENLDKLIFIYEVARQIDIKYDKHLERCQHKSEPDKCPINLYYFKCKFFAEQEIRSLNPSFEYSILRPNINSDLLKQNIVALKDFPEAAKLFQTAMDKLNECRFERNLLDDLRLSLEVLLKSLLKNNKSLENQIDSIGDFLKQSGTSKEVVNMFRTLTDYFSKYQNAYVKHNDHIKENEVDLLVNLTSAFINFMIQNR